MQVTSAWVTRLVHGGCRACMARRRGPEAIQALAIRAADPAGGQRTLGTVGRASGPSVGRAAKGFNADPIEWSSAPRGNSPCSVGRMATRDRNSGDPGDVFAVRLGPGSYGLAWLTASGSPRIATDLVLVGGDWFGQAPPRDSLPPLRPLQEPLAEWEGAPVNRVVVFISGPPPSDWLRVGRLQGVAPAECASFSGRGWDWMRLELLRRWRSIHEPEALKTEDAAKAKAQGAVRRAAAVKEAARLNALTLDSLARKHWLSTWIEYPSKAQAAACRALLRAAVKQLRAEPLASTRRKVQVIRSLVEGLNELDARGGFIETMCREDLCAAITDVAVAAGLRTLRDWRTIADRWRDW